MGRIRSRKALLLGEVYGRPWWLVALEWDNRALSQAEIAAAWEKDVQRTDPSVTYNQQDVSNVMRLARIKAQEPATVAVMAVAG